MPQKRTRAQYPEIEERYADYVADFRDEMVYARMSRGYFQKDVARNMGVKFTQIGVMEHCNPRLDTLVRYLMAIGCKLAIVDDPDSPFRRDQA